MGGKQWNNRYSSLTGFWAASLKQINSLTNFYVARPAGADCGLSTFLQIWDIVTITVLSLWIWFTSKFFGNVEKTKMTAFEIHFIQPCRSQYKTCLHLMNFPHLSCYPAHTDQLRFLIFVCMIFPAHFNNATYLNRLDLNMKLPLVHKHHPNSL